MSIRLKTHSFTSHMHVSIPLNSNIFQALDIHIEMFAHTLHLFAAHATDDLPL